MNPTPQHWKEARRLQAWRLKQKGWPQRQIADALGVSAAAVSQWMQWVRSQTIKEFLTNGAAHRLHLERLPAYAPELNPDEGLWQQLKGVELRNVFCLTGAAQTASHPELLSRGETLGFYARVSRIDNLKRRYLSSRPLPTYE